MSSNSEEAKEWAEKHSVRIQNLYEKWQKPLGIDREYEEYLTKYLIKEYHDPLKKELYESIF